MFKTAKNVKGMLNSVEAHHLSQHATAKTSRKAGINTWQTNVMGDVDNVTNVICADTAKIPRIRFRSYTAFTSRGLHTIFSILLI